MAMSPSRAVAYAKSRFRELGTPERAEGERAYMKSALRFHGVTAQHVRAVAKELCDANAWRHDELRAVVDALYATDFFDLHSLAIALLERRARLVEPTDAAWLVDLARTSACWAHVDYLSTKVIGPLVDRHPALVADVKRWAKHDDFWVRRVALLSMLGALRKGGGDFALFERLAAPMLVEKEFFIRKAIGWVLREVSKSRPELVFAFLRDHGARASGLTFREGSKYLPDAMKKKLRTAQRPAR